MKKVNYNIRKRKTHLCKKVKSSKLKGLRGLHQKANNLTHPIIDTNEGILALITFLDLVTVKLPKRLADINFF